MAVEGQAPRRLVPPWRGFRRPHSKSVRETRRLGVLMVLPALLVSGALVLYPLVKGFNTSLHTGGAGTGLPSQYVGLQNYSHGLQDPTTGQAIVHTLVYVGIALTIEIAAGLFIAVTLQRAFRGRGIVLAILILPWALPSVVSGLLWRRVFDPQNGLLNHLLLDLHIIHDPQVWLSGAGAIPFITLVHAWGVIPLVSLIFIAGLQSIPDEVYAASAVDGATPLRQFRHITLPLLWPSLAVAATVGTIAAINIFDEIYVLNGTALNTRSIVMQVYNTTFNQGDFSTGTALAFLVGGATALFGIFYTFVFRRTTV
jgi:multiple sugar transport system permease protein